MTRYFTIAASGLTSDQEKRLTEIWANYGWWHGITNFWLFHDHTGVLTAADIRNTITEIAPGAQTIIVEIDPITWAGNSMTESNRDWLRQFWPPENPSKRMTPSIPHANTAQESDIR